MESNTALANIVGFRQNRYRLPSVTSPKANGFSHRGQKLPVWRKCHAVDRRGMSFENLRPVSRSHTRIALSVEAVAKNESSGDQTMLRSLTPNPLRARCNFPVSAVQS